jgi:hypothetical protein
MPDDFLTRPQEAVTVPSYRLIAIDVNELYVNAGKHYTPR